MNSLEALKTLCKLIPRTEVPAKEIVKNYEIIKQDLKRLEKLEAKDKKWQELFGRDLCEVLGRELLKQENDKLKQAIKILKDRLDMQVISNGYINDMPDLTNYYFNYKINNNIRTLTEITKEEYELLKEVTGE